jgi:hypothetical protein
MGTANYDASRLTQVRRNRTIANYAQTLTQQIDAASGTGGYSVRTVQQPNTTGNIIAYKNEAPCACNQVDYRRTVGQICCGAATQ